MCGSAKNVTTSGLSPCTLRSASTAVVLYASYFAGSGASVSAQSRCGATAHAFGPLCHFHCAISWPSGDSGFALCSVPRAPAVCMRFMISTAGGV